MEKSAMRFNVIIGNPPYQVNNGGGKGASANPLYQKFIEKSIDLKPLYITMITPSRWFSGNKPEFKKFRKFIKKTKVNFSYIYDFKNSKECFSNVIIDGGVNYFLISFVNKTTIKNTLFAKIEDGKIIDCKRRKLFEDNLDFIIRDNKSVSIINKINRVEKNNDRFDVLVSSQDPFGFDKRIKGTMKRQKIIKHYHNNGNMLRYLDKRNKYSYVKKDDISKNNIKIDKFKIVIEKAINKKINPIILRKNEVCSETFLAIFLCSEHEALCLKSYMETNLFNFLFYSKKISHNSSKVDFELIPLLDFTKEWTDEELYKRYNLTVEEIDYIEKSIKEMK